MNEQRTMELKNFSTTIREILNKVSLHATTHDHYDVVPQESSDDMVLVITNRTYRNDLEEIALALSSADYIVKYMGTNFLVVRKNPTPTSETITGNLDFTPISFEEAKKRLTKYENQVEVVYPDDSEINCATIVAKQSYMRPVLAEIALMLSCGGMYVRYHEGCNFIEFEECLEYEQSQPIIIRTNIRAGAAAMLPVEKMAMG